MVDLAELLDTEDVGLIDRCLASRLWARTVSHSSRSRISPHGAAPWKGRRAIFRRSLPRPPSKISARIAAKRSGGDFWADDLRDIEHRCCNEGFSYERWRGSWFTDTQQFLADRYDEWLRRRYPSLRSRKFSTSPTHAITRTDKAGNKKSLVRKEIGAPSTW